MNSEPENTLWDLRLNDFREATASGQPTPGGGSVAGVSATLGLGLVIMALEISSKRKDAIQPEETQALI
jgi:formiminotetrahydrofolate cyclodeaminase